MLSMAETLNLVHKHGLGQALITRLQAKRSKENAKVVKEKVFGQRSEKKPCLCRPICRKEGCFLWHEAKIDADISPLAISRSFTYWARKATEEVKRVLTESQLRAYQEIQGILYFRARIAPQEVQVRNLNLKFMARQGLRVNYDRPAVLATSPIGYAIAVYAHWTLAPHCGVEYTLGKCIQYFHIIGARKLITKIRRDCMKCRILQSRTQRVEMARVSP